jgi:tetratricopeptide (TPR) repeat protein
LNIELKNSKDQKTKLEFGDIPAAQPDLENAEKAFLEAIKLKPELRTAYFFLGKLYAATHKQRQALERLETVTAKTNDATAFMQMGIIHDQLKEYPASRDAYEKVLKVDANSRTTNPGVRAAALNNLAYLYSEKLNDLDKGYDMAVKARDLQPYDPFAADTLGWILYQRGEFTRALALLEESRSALAQKPLLPEIPEIMLHLGLSYYMLEQEAPARRALEQAQRTSEDFPHKEQAAQKLAILAIDPRTADAKVTSELEKLQQDSPNDPVVAGKLGEIQERDGAFDKAAKTYERCLKINPQNAPVMFRAARLYAFELHDSARALELAKAAHELAPNDARISHLLGRLVFQTSDYVWASSLLEESARKLPKETDVLYDLAWSRYSMGRDSDALATMHSVLQSTGSVARVEEARKFISLVQAARGAPIPANAEVEAQKTVSTNATYVPGLMVLALVQEQHSARKEAAETYQRILNSYPNFTPALRNLAILTFEQGDDRKAYQLASKAIESMPDDAELSKTLGVLAFRRGDYEQSERLLKSSLLKRNRDAELLFYLGKAQYKLNEQVGSKQSLLKALDLNLPPKLAEEARQILKGFK